MMEASSFSLGVLAGALIVVCETYFLGHTSPSTTQQ